MLKVGIVPIRAYPIPAKKASCQEFTFGIKESQDTSVADGVSSNTR